MSLYNVMVHKLLVEYQPIMIIWVFVENWILLSQSVTGKFWAVNCNKIYTCNIKPGKKEMTCEENWFVGLKWTAWRMVHVGHGR